MSTTGLFPILQVYLVLFVLMLTCTDRAFTGTVLGLLW